MCLITGLIIAALGSGCGKWPTPRADGMAPGEDSEATDDPTVDHWNAVRRACRTVRQPSPTSTGRGTAVPGGDRGDPCRPEGGADPDLDGWAERVANRYEIKADIRKTRNDPDFFARAAGEAQARQSSTVAEGTEPLLLQWEAGSQPIRREGVQLRDRLRERHGKYLPPCAPDAPN